MRWTKSILDIIVSHQLFAYASLQSATQSSPLHQNNKRTKISLSSNNKRKRYVPYKFSSHLQLMVNSSLQNPKPKDSMLHSLSLPSFSSSSNSPPKTLNPHRLSSSPHSPLYLKFRTAHQENLRYLKAIGVFDPYTKPHKLPSPDAITQILTTINLFKSKGFTDKDFSRLAFLCPQLFSIDFDITDIEPVFEFLTTEIPASVEESKGMIMRCPQLLLSDVEYCLRPTLNYLKQLGVAKLNIPSNLTAHLLNTRVEKMCEKVRFLRSIGFSCEEAERACTRLPAILRYGVESNLRPKVEYFVKEMGRSLEELKEFPQYFAFSLKKRIVPRHMHLKERNVRIKLNRMLMWSDERFYAKWK